MPKRTCDRDGMPCDRPSNARLKGAFWEAKIFAANITMMLATHVRRRSFWQR